MKNRSEANGSKANDWETPDYIYKFLDVFFQGKPFFDPCPLNSTFDGLSIINWHDRNYINPPYTRKLKEQFIKKAYKESLKGKQCIMLIPASTDTKIFHEVIAPTSKILLIKGRVKFKGYNTKGEYVTDKTGQTGSMFVIFGRIPEIITIDLKKYKEAVVALVDEGQER